MYIQIHVLLRRYNPFLIKLNEADLNWLAVIGSIRWAERNYELLDYSEKKSIQKIKAYVIFKIATFYKIIFLFA